MKPAMTATLAAIFLAMAGALGQEPPSPRLASGIDLTAFDMSVRPQDDFFRYVNGGLLDKTAIPEDKASYGTWDVLRDKLEEDIRAIVDDAGTASDGTPAEARKVGDFYAAYMDEAAAERAGLGPLEAELAAVDAVRTKAELARAFGRLSKIFCNMPFDFGATADFIDPKVNMLLVLQGGLGLPDRDYYLKDDAKLAEYRTKYLVLLAALLKLAGDPAPDKTASEVMSLETELAKSHLTNVEAMEVTKMHNPVAAGDMAKQYPGFEWTSWAAEVGVAALPTLVVAHPSYLKAFAEAFSQWPVERWKPYLRASIIRTYAPVLSKAFRDVHFNFYARTLRGVEREQPRWRRAIRALNEAMGHALGKVYVSRYFKPEAKARMERLVENLREAYRSSIDQLEWMGPATKKEAQQKLTMFRAKIGYPKKWRDYSQLEIRRDDVVGNLMRGARFQFDYNLSQAGKPVDPEEWWMTPQTVDAFYQAEFNAIVFPAAILQPPFFNMAADDAVNYGAIGAVIGHEMGHGFDNQGRRFDGTGKMRDWWTAADATEYEKRTAQLVKQAGQWDALPGVKLNGRLTLGENIGDLTGLVVAHRAYLLSLAGKPAPILDGLTGNQRFFAGWAQVWRSKMREEAIRQQVLNNVHAPAMLRCNMPLVNIPAFYAAFGVKQGDKLFVRPEERVTIW